MIDIRRDVPGLWCDDITFCSEKCDWKQCPRNQKNILDRTVPHSFSIDIPGDCPKLLEGRRSEMTDKEKVIASLDNALVQMHGCGRYTPEDVDELETAAWKALELLKEQEEQIERLEHDLAVAQNNLNYYVNGND